MSKSSSRTLQKNKLQIHFCLTTFPKFSVTIGLTSCKRQNVSVLNKREASFKSVNCEIFLHLTCLPQAIVAKLTGKRDRAMWRVTVGVCHTVVIELGYRTEVTALRLPHCGYRTEVTALRLPHWGYRTVVTTLLVWHYGYGTVVMTLW